MTDELGTQEQLDRDYRKMLRMYDALPDPVLFVNRKGIITKINERTVRFFGLDRERMIGQNVAIVMPERFRAGHAHNIEHYFEDPETRPMGINLDIIALQDGGRKETPVTIMLSPLVSGDETEAIAVIRRKIEAGRPATQLLQNIRAYCVEHGIDAPFVVDINKLVPSE